MKNIHRFLTQREWGELEQDKGIGGIAWTELFILFDTSEARTPNGRHVKNLEADKRAKDRKDSRAKSKAGAQSKQLSNCNVLPSLQEELSTFKAIVRDIARHEMQVNDGRTFKAEVRQQTTRLANLGMLGNHVAIAGHCKISNEERDTLTEAILKQKVGQPRKA